VLILAVAEDLNKLFQDRSVTPMTSLCELCRVMVVAVNVSTVLVVAVGRAKHCRAEGAREVVYVILSVQSCDVGTAQRAATLVAEKAESSEVVSLAKRILPIAVFVVGGEEFGCHNLVTVSTPEAIEMECSVEGPDELSREGLTALFAYAGGTARAPSPISLLRTIPIGALSGLIVTGAHGRYWGRRRGARGLVVGVAIVGRPVPLERVPGTRFRELVVVWLTPDMVDGHSVIVARRHYCERASVASGTDLPIQGFDITGLRYCLAPGSESTSKVLSGRHQLCTSLSGQA
jgi:hypothetical protein